MIRCSVSNCMYVAEARITIVDLITYFDVCALHDHPATRAILEAGRRPGAYWTKNGFSNWGAMFKAGRAS